MGLGQINEYTIINLNRGSTFNLVLLAIERLIFVNHFFRKAGKSSVVKSYYIFTPSIYKIIHQINPLD